MPSKSLKPLYIAKTWEELKKRAEDPTSQLNVNDLISLTKSADKLYLAAKEADRDGDEERCYILFYRFLQIVTNINKSKISQKDKEYAINMITRKKCEEALEKLERVGESLSKRYSTLKESQELRVKQIAESNDNTNSIKTNIDSNNSKQLEVSDSSYPLIECQTLLEELENSKDIKRILIFDTRDAIDYNESHIDRLKTNADLNIVNLPKEHLKAGLTASKLEKALLLGNVCDLLSRRRTMSKVIILDQFSQEIIPNTPAFYLADALWKWDTSSLKIRNKPYLLKGGYEEWSLTYPMYTSNANYVQKTNNFPQNKRQLNLKFNYELSELENEPKKPDNHLANGLPNGQIQDEEVDEILDDTDNSRLTGMFGPRPSKAAVPGTAQLASAMPSIPDRSTKPKIQTENKISYEKTTTEPKEDNEKFKLRKLNETTEEMLSIVQKQNLENTQALMDEIKRKDEENLRLKSTIRRILPEKPSNVQTVDTNGTTNTKQNDITNGEINGVDKRNGIHPMPGMSGDDNKENDENNEFHIRNSVSMIGAISNETPVRPTVTKNIIKSANSLPVNSNLSRSQSSPNIAQLLAKELNENHSFENIDPKDRWSTDASQPQFDRNLKPQFSRGTLNDNKVRDFCVVHSAGNSITGLRNLGNTCFMNAVIQCLLNTTEFSTFFTNGLSHINKNSKFGSNGELVMELAALFRAMAYPSSYKSISPKDFKQAVSKHIQGFIGCSQQDSHEFLVFLIEKLHADLNESTARDVIDTSIPQELSLGSAANKFWKEHTNKNKSIITNLFEGLFVNSLTCLTCRNQSKSFEQFRILSLPLSNNRTNLNECLNQFFKPDRLSGESAYDCPTCKTKREADKKVALWKLPKVLIIHLKRFLYEGVWRQKNQIYVDFPIDELYIHSLSKSETKYSLYGVVNHYGTLEGGHYTAFSQNKPKYKWHRFDDQEITQINAADVKTQAAYILFYKCC